MDKTAPVKTAETRVRNGDVTLAVTRRGAGGQKLIFFNGCGAAQVVWNQVIGQLKGDYEIITFDFRGHGKSSPAPDHSFEAFLGDAECVMEAVGGGQPIVVGWSLGADLALAYAAARPGALGGLVIVDGAVPLADRLVEDEAGMRRLLNSVSMKVSMFLLRLTAWRYSLSGDAIADITMDVDARRQNMLGLYSQLDCPATMVLATRSAGPNTTAHARRNNRLWREGAERLASACPSLPIRWLEAGHRLPLSRPAELAGTIDTFAEGLRQD
ncbi:MAG: alpha/beta fold hydrolase [Alphaproteobacteria bacterium]|nr:alpha/beta fold hydrolase [Alphaproteobacteria bacterium]